MQLNLTASQYLFGLSSIVEFFYFHKKEKRWYLSKRTKCFYAVQGTVPVQIKKADIVETKILIF